MAVDQHRDAPQRTQALELVAAEEWRDRVNLVGELLEVDACQHLADIGADETADDRKRPGQALQDATCAGPRQAGWTRCSCSATYVADSARDVRHAHYFAPIRCRFRNRSPGARRRSGPGAAIPLDRVA